MLEPIPAVAGGERRILSGLQVGIGIALFALVFGGGLALGGEPRQIALASLNALPFAVLAVLAYRAARSFNWAWLATGLWALLLLGGVAVVSLGLGFATLVDLRAAQANPGAPPQIAPGVWLRMGLIALGLAGGMLASALLLIPALRRQLARVIPLDPDSFVHTVALITVVGVSILCTVPLLVLGQPPLLAMVGQIGEGAAIQGRGAAGQLRDQLYGLAWTIPATILAVGYGSRRRLPEALARLGLVRPTWRQALAGVGIALLLAGAVQLISVVIAWLWGALGWPTTDSAAFGELLSFAISPLGAVVIGVTAGLGEELAVRGVLQPRLGILLSNLFFTSLHALQYNWDALLIVFLVGLVCGVVRKRSNTSTSAIVHGVYNFTLIMLAVLTGS